jgi:hypothetical protein
MDLDGSEVATGGVGLAAVVAQRGIENPGAEADGRSGAEPANALELL